VHLRAGDRATLFTLSTVWGRRSAARASRRRCRSRGRTPHPVRLDGIEGIRDARLLPEVADRLGVAGTMPEVAPASTDMLQRTSRPRSHVRDSLAVNSMTLKFAPSAVSRPTRCRMRSLVRRGREPAVHDDLDGAGTWMFTARPRAQTDAISVAPTRRPARPARRGSSCGCRADNHGAGRSYLPPPSPGGRCRPSRRARRETSRCPGRRRTRAPSSGSWPSSPIRPARVVEDHRDLRRVPDARLEARALEDFQELVDDERGVSCDIAMSTAGSTTSRR